MKTLRYLIMIIIVIGALAIGGVFYAYKVLESGVLPPAPAPAPDASSSAAVPAAPSSPFGTSSPLTAYLAAPMGSSTPDTSSWHIYEDDQLGYFIQYPSDLTVDSDSGSSTFVFPPSSYFHWPLLDTAKISVTVAPACPAVTAGALSVPDSQIQLNGYSFTRVIGTDVGAGNLYTEIAYDTTANGLCYHIDFFDHGTNGASFYVGDPSLIAQYDGQHAADMAQVLAIFNGMVASFRENTALAH